MRRDALVCSSLDLLVDPWLHDMIGWKLEAPVSVCHTCINVPFLEFSVSQYRIMQLNENDSLNLSTNSWFIGSSVARIRRYGGKSWGSGAKPTAGCLGVSNTGVNGKLLHPERLSHFPSLHLPFPSPSFSSLPSPLQVGPLIAARESAGALKLSQWVWTKPGRQKPSAAFSAYEYLYSPAHADSNKWNKTVQQP